MVQFLYDNRTASATCLVETRLGETCFVFFGGGFRPSHAPSRPVRHARADAGSWTRGTGGTFVVYVSKLVFLNEWGGAERDFSAFFLP